MSVSEFLKEGTKYLSGLEEAILRNIEAVKQLSDVTRTSLGPNGMNKIVVNHIEKLYVTSDANTIVRELDVIHPAAKMLVMAAQQQVRVKQDNGGIGLRSANTTDAWLKRSAEFTRALAKLNERVQRKRKAAGSEDGAEAGGGGGGGRGSGDGRATKKQKKRKKDAADGNLQSSSVTSGGAGDVEGGGGGDGGGAQNPRSAMYRRRSAQKDTRSYSREAMAQIFGFAAAQRGDTLADVTSDAVPAAAAAAAAAGKQRQQRAGSGKAVVAEATAAAAPAAARGARQPAKVSSSSGRDGNGNGAGAGDGGAPQHGLKTVTSALSMQDYFRQRMAALHPKALHAAPALAAAASEDEEAALRRTVAFIGFGDASHAVAPASPPALPSAGTPRGAAKRRQAAKAEAESGTSTTAAIVKSKRAKKTKSDEKAAQKEQRRILREKLRHLKKLHNK